MSRTTRRRFLQASAVAGAGSWLAGSSTRLAWGISKSPNEKLTIGIIGSGGKGMANLKDVMSENIVALCDVDEKRAAESFAALPNATRYHDFRKMLEERKDLDAVVVSTPDHTHAVASVMAMRLGKHVYCEKPLAHSVYEARVMRETAAPYHVATQMGNQGTSEDGFRQAVEVIRSGAIGNVNEVHVWTNRPIWPQGIERPTDTVAVPDTMKWDLWLGPAPERTYNPKYAPFAWRGWWDFGTGALGDMACHTANMAFMALDLGYPTTIEAESSGVNNETGPVWSVIRYEFPARGQAPPIKFTWYDGGEKLPEEKRPSKELLQGKKPSGSGSLLVGDKGTLYSPNDYGAQFILLPESDFAGYKPPEPTLPRTPGHHEEWIAACKGGPPAMSNFDYAGVFTESMLLGIVALRVGKKIEWDGVAMKATNCPEADQYIRPEFRKGWAL